MTSCQSEILGFDVDIQSECFVFVFLFRISLIVLRMHYVKQCLAFPIVQSTEEWVCDRGFTRRV